MSGLGDLMGQPSFLGNTEKLDDAVMPLPEQTAFDVGDVAILGSSSAPAERDFALLQMLNAEDYAEQYPDRKERMEVYGYVLCRHFSKDDPEFTVGWFSRIKLMPISIEHYTEAMEWLLNGFPENRPEWVNDYWTYYRDQLSEQAPDKVPTTVRCPGCGGKKVLLKINHRMTQSGRAGKMTVDGREVYIPVSDPEEQRTTVAKLACTDCPATKDLADNEWHIPN